MPMPNLTPYATHLPILARMIRKHRPVTAIEHGVGWYSTLLMHASCQSLVSYDGDVAWCQRVREAVPGLYIRSPSSTPPLGSNADLIFVDGATTERAAWLDWALNWATPKVVIAHDFMSPSYRYASVHHDRAVWILTVDPRFPETAVWERDRRGC